ncbi:MAG: hypothetical protein ACXIUB_06870 [Wenzhouxiangella sp.]
MTGPDLSLPPLPPRYRFKSIIGGLFGLAITLAVSILFGLSMLETQERFELQHFDLHWDAEATELRLQGQLRGSDLPVDLVLTQAIPARLYQEPYPAIYRMAGEDGYWSLVRLHGAAKLAAFLVLGGFFFLMIRAIHWGLQPHLHRRRVTQAPRQLEAHLIGVHNGRAGRPGFGATKLMFQVMIDGVLWRFDYPCHACSRQLNTASGPRPLQSGDRFRFYCQANDPNIYFLPAELEAVETPEETAKLAH